MPPFWLTKKKPEPTTVDAPPPRPKVDRTKPPHELYPELVDWEEGDEILWGAKMFFYSIDRDGVIIVSYSNSVELLQRFDFYETIAIGRLPFNVSLHHRRALQKTQDSKPYMKELKARRPPVKK